MEPKTANTPPPPISADITEALRWGAAVAALAGHPDSIEIQARVRTILITFCDIDVMKLWAITIGETLRTSVSDELGATTRVFTTERALWHVTLYAHVPAVQQ